MGAPILRCDPGVCTEEVDTNPAPGWSGARTIVDLPLPVLLQHYDLPSLFASKLAAILTRPYTKGRDVYDLFWYRTKWKGLEPSFRLLNSALTQATRSFDFGHMTPDNWLEVLSKKTKLLRWKDIEGDIKPFLESLDDLVVFTKENLLTALQKTQKANFKIRYLEARFRATTFPRMKKAKPTLLEPIMNIEVYTPDTYMGDIMGNLNGRRGKVTGMEQKLKRNFLSLRDTV